jgi:potassium/hydrogen antiporter
MGSEAIHIAQGVLVTFAIIFVAGAIAGKVADLLGIPDVVVYLLIGIVIGPPGLDIINLPAESVLNQLMLIIGASFLLFHGGMGVSFSVLKNVWFTLLLLSTLAVLIMVAIVGYTTHLVLGIPLLSALLLAAVLAPTDPATLVPIFLSVKIKDRLAQTVLSESAFNDATGAIVTFTILGIITTGEISLSASLSKFLIMAGGGMIIGILCGLLAGFIITDRSKDIFAEYAQVLTLPVIIVSYITAEHFGASGFMAVFMAGLMYGNLDELGWTMRENHQDELHSFIHIGSLLLRMAIFILLGTHVDFTIVQQYLLPGIIIVMVFMLIARPIAVLVCTLPDRIAKWERNEILFMFWTRETGVIPAALSGMLIGMGVAYADIIAAITFLAILATLVIQASTTKWLAEKLHLLEAQPNRI